MLEMDAHFFPAWWGLAVEHMQQGKHGQSIAAARKAVEISEGHPHALISLAHVLAAAGERDETLAVLYKLRQLSSKHYISPHYFALIYARLGEADMTFEELHKACEYRDFWAFWLVEPDFDTLHSDPRFARLIQHVGLTPYSKRLMGNHAK
jgi:tetratricopeptide (TPR) repeat protein